METALLAVTEALHKARENVVYSVIPLCSLYAAFYTESPDPHLYPL